jgi:glycosyltransferase involved in cell wall biosynthesis
MNPQVTVLMSVYNGLSFLSESIRSVLSQTFTDFEFLIINDGSTDDVGSVLDAITDSRVRIFCQRNMGLTRTLNRGIRLSRGAFIARMDADDISAPDRIEKQMAVMRDNHRLDMVGTFFSIINAQGKVIEKKELIQDPIYRLWRMQFHNNYAHGSMLLRKESLVHMGSYDQTLPYAQDFDLWSRMSNKDNTFIIGEYLYKYRMINSGPQTSVLNYEAQLNAAIEISNRSLKADNPELSETECSEVRALYWKFQLPYLQVSAFPKTFHTLKGFCNRFGVGGDDLKHLARRVTKDIQAELMTHPQVSSLLRDDLFKDFEEKVHHLLHGDQFGSFDPK